jgi:dTDP-4-dehydrorhamnose 3,5-epimerase
MATVRPRQIKGWIVHQIQDDRLFVAFGALKIVLYDARLDSPTYRMITENVLTERNRGSIRIPRGVFHAVQNIGDVDAVYVNCPTHPYNHADPDKFRLPPDTDEIPYSFEQRLGW